MGLVASKDELTIANMALDLLGQDSIVDFTSTKTGQLMARWLPQVRQSLLRSPLWNFANKRTTCPRTRTPEFDFTDAYALPADFIRFESFVTGIQGGSTSATNTPNSITQRERVYDIAANPLGGTEILCNASKIQGAATNQTYTTYTITIGGTATAGDTISITFTANGLAGSPVTVSVPVNGTDSMSAVASRLARAISTNPYLQGSGIFANGNNNAVTVNYPTTLTMALSSAVTGAQTEVIALAPGTQLAIAVLSLRYIYDCDDPARWDPTARQLWVLYLAKKTCYQITKSEARCKAIDDDITKLLPDAVSTDGQENPPIRVERSPSIAARRRGSLGNDGVAGPYTDFGMNWHTWT